MRCGGSSIFSFPMISATTAECGFTRQSIRTLQARAEKAVDAHLRKVEARAGYAHPKKADFSAQAREEEQQPPYLQGALVVIDNRSGGIRALVGGRDFAESKYNRAILPQAARQVGSTFKPFVYAAAFARGLLPGAAIDDGPIARGEVRAATNWTPDNSDGAHKGVLRAEEGLIQSRNTMTVRVGEFAGLPTIAQGLQSLPVSMRSRKQPSIYLGAFETTVAELTSAYTVFPNNGMRRQSYMIERIDDAAGEIIYRAAHVTRAAMDPGVSWLTTGVLAKVMDHGTGSTAKTLGFAKPSAGKTGTTNDYHDAWFVGFTTSLDLRRLGRPRHAGDDYGARVRRSAGPADLGGGDECRASRTRYPAGVFKAPGVLSRIARLLNIERPCHDRLRTRARSLRARSAPFRHPAECLQHARRRDACRISPAASAGRVPCRRTFSARSAAFSAAINLLQEERRGAALRRPNLIHVCNKEHCNFRPRHYLALAFFPEERPTS